MSKPIIFLGTGNFALPSLRALLGERDFEIQLVVTQPDQPRGRGQKIIFDVIKNFALENNLPLAQPEKTKDLAEILKKYQSEALVVVSYGKILSQEILDLPVKGCLNVHPSLLPKYRGSAPVPGAILAGETTTGVTIMLLDAEMDHGPILTQKEVKIEPFEPAGDLLTRLSEVGANLLVPTLKSWFSGLLEPRTQNHAQATFTRQLEKKDGQIDWSRSPLELERQIRAFNPWPGAFTFWEGKMLKILRAQSIEQKNQAPLGLVISQTGKDLSVVCGTGVLNILELQLEGRKALVARDFLAGNKKIVGATLETIS